VLRRRSVHFALLSALFLLLVPAAAMAKTGPCRPDGSGPKCQVWTGKVTSINDGDTFAVDIAGDGKKRSYAIRFIGVQAMEQTRYNKDPKKRRGECHALQATNLVEKMVRQAHGRVRLTAQRPRTDTRGRLLRSVNLRIGGRWVDVGEQEMATGVTLWMHNNHESAWNKIYNRLGQTAARQGIGIWNKTTCGVGPAQDVPLKVWVMSDPFGDDNRNKNAEWIRVQNLSPTKTVSLARWWVRDSGHRLFKFPGRTSLSPGEALIVHVGRGRSSGNSYYWGLTDTIFENSVNGDDVGDGAYLFDPKGDLRAWLVYPCLVSCSDPNQGAVRVIAHPSGREYVRVVNVSGHSVDLFGYQLRMPGAYAFPRGTVLDPGDDVEVDVGGNPANDNSRVLHMGMSGLYLVDRGGAVSVATFDEIDLACDSWGNGHC
jgi:endonuclease YncB( thermonuclease family)